MKSIVREYRVLGKNITITPVIWIGIHLCRYFRDNTVMYNTIRHSLRSGNLRVIAAYRFSKVVYGG